jgi:hypothetical protein
MKCIYLLTFFSTLLLNAQNTLQLAEGQQSPEASLESVSWITGHWQGEAFGGIAEEIWSAPAGGSMMFVFRLINDEKVTFYEIGHIKQVKTTLLMQLKHFHGDLKGWEEKDDTIDFKLVKLEENAVYFDGLTMKKISDDKMHVFVLIEEEGIKNEAVFEYQKL